MKNFYHLVLSGLLLCLTAGVSAQPLSVMVTDANGAQGTQVCVDIVGRDFDNISAFTFSLIFDPAILQYEDDQTTGSMLLGNTVDFNLNTNTPNAVRTLWSLFFASEGITDAGPFIIGNVCFTVLVEQETSIQIENMPVPIVFSTPFDGDISDFMVTGGIINGNTGPSCTDGIMNGNETGIDCGGPDCPACPPTPTCDDGIMNGNETGVDCGGPDCDTCPPTPTCDDGIMNGNETGVDCGGPDCDACPGDTGGPNLDCGMGTDNLVFCVGDVCNVGAAENFCVDITTGNMTDITAFQMDLAFETGQLLYQSITTSDALSNSIQVSPFGSFIRLLFFQPDQSGNTVPDGTIIASVCFTNQTTEATTLTPTNLTARDTNNDLVTSEGNAGSVNDCDGTAPTCNDGMMNGNETGVDCGGPDCAPCNTGGPDTDCGMGTDDFVLCFGDACDIDVNGTACIDITAGNLTNITAFQADVIFADSDLTFVSFTDAGALSHPINANTATGTPRLLFFQPDQSGNTIPNGTIIGTVCFTNLSTDASTVSFANLTARDNNGVAIDATSTSGSVNGCANTTPTCSDGMMNGNETGVDCGGPDCAPCNTTGGPDTDCGMNTDDFVLCFGDACDIDVNGTACIDITAGNLTNITAFQADVIFADSDLTFVSFTDAGALSHPINANTATGTPRLLFFQPDQSGNTIPNGTIIGTVCFTNLTTDASVVDISNLTARDNNGLDVDAMGNSGSINDCSSTTPTCSDGMMNGNETGIDCGGPDCAPCSTTGGPDTDCGMGTDDFVLCFGDACDIDVNGTACLDITAGNLTNITAFQADVITNNNELTFVSFTDAGALSHPIIANTATGIPRLLFFQPDQSGNTIPSGTIIGTVCFTNLNADASVASLDNLTARDNNGTAIDVTGSNGTVNGCVTTTPTCMDGMMNGNETGVDCGGPDCAPCNTTGGPDLDCGMGTTDVTLCLGDACDVDVNGTACLDITVGNFTNITAFQADIIANNSELNFLSWTDAGALSHPVIANTAPGFPRLLFFQPDQSGNTVPGGTIIGTVCFTNLNAGASTVMLTGLTSRDNNGDAQPTSGSSGTVNDCATTGPTCDDGIMNGNETGIDCGGPDCDACPTCDDGIQNGDETGIDCGGSCDPCLTGCGEGTTDAQICVGEVCADAGAEACVPIFIGNFNDLGGFQFELAYTASNLEYTRFTQSTSLGPVLTVGNPSDGRVTVLWNDASLTGLTLPNDEPVLEICFTVENGMSTDITFLNPAQTLRVFNEFAQSLPVTSNPGSINGSGCTTGPTCADGIMNGNETGIDCGGPDCGACPPTCDDGIMNGNETGVDCGGPDCPACDTGGPDTDCGMGTDNVTLCLGDACNIPVNGTACLPLTVGNFTDITAFQADIISNASELTFVSWNDAGVLSHPIIGSGTSSVRLLFFQPDQSGNTVADGTVIGEVCFTNLTTDPSEVILDNINARDNNGNPVAVSGSSGFVNNCATGPTCDDGIMNGNETGVDCGGPDCDACPSNPLLVDAMDGSANIGDEVCIDVTIGDFTNITDLALTLNYDQAVLQFESLTPNPGLSGLGVGNFDTSTPGQIVLNYTTASGQTLADDAVLFSVCWTVLAGTETDLTISNATATNGSGTALTVNTSDGVVNAGGVSPSDDLTFRVGSASGSVNQEVCVEVTTDNFDNIVGFQYAITYDAERLQFSSATSTNALVGLLVTNPEPGIIRVLWADFGAAPNDLADGTNLFDLCFNVLIACETDLEIEDIPGFPVRATDGNNQNVGMIETIGGTINSGLNTDCDVTSPDNIVLDLGTASGAEGQEVCIDLTVNNFTALTDLSFSITYDQSIVSFTQANNFGLASLTAADVTLDAPGVITFNWDAANATGETLTDGSVLLSLCFTIDELQPSTVSFANGPVIIQAMNGSGQNVGIIPSGGSINPDVPMTDGMALVIGDATGNIGETVCLPFTAFDPEALTGFQFTITYDPTILEYIPGNNNFTFSGFLGINGNTPGLLRTLWDEPTATANTAGNGEVIFEVCFRILSEDPAIICIEDAPTPIEFSLGVNEVEVDLFCGQINGGEAPMIASADVNNPSCFGGNDGSISLNVTGGNDLTYTWSPDVGNGPSIDGLTAGNYAVTITNPNTGQTTTENYTLSTVEFRVEVTDASGVTCFGEADGSITISTVGGAAPFIIDWSGTLQDGLLTQNDLDGGVYSVTVTDNNGCSMSQTNINIGEPTALNVSGTPINISDDTPGGVNIVVAGGRPEYSYSWSGPGGYTSTNKDIDDVTVAGTYCVTVTDNNNCTDEQCFAINAALAVGIVVDPGCFGEDNGSIDITPVGGTGDYTYVWSNGGMEFANTQDVDDLAPGDYTLVITSGTQEITQTIEVDTPDPITIAGMVTAATSGNNGAITITPGGGNAPYTFAWADGPTAQNRTDLTPGEYCVTVTDNSDCTSSECFTVGAAPVSFLSTSTLPALCSDSADGTIRLVIENGARPFSVRIEPLGTVETVDSNTIEILVPAGTYDVFVTDAQGGMLNTNLTVEAPSAISATSTVTSDTEDDGCSGMISLDISGGTAGYNVTWNNMAAGGTISQLCSGDYVATITDINGCTFVTEPITVNRIDESIVAITEVSCDGGTDGAIDVMIEGGVEPYTFSWTETGSTTELADTEDITAISNGSYTLTVIDATGAMLVRNYTVGVTAGFTVAATVTSDYLGFGVSCVDATDGSAAAVISGQGDFDFEWLQNDTTIDTDSILNDVGAGTYLLLVTSAAGCEIERTVEITAPEAITLTPTITAISCGNTNDGMITVTPAGGVSPYSFEWSDGSDSGQRSSLGAGSYGLTVTDANNCIAEDNYVLTAPEDLAITFETSDATDGCNGSITILPLGGSGTGYSYFWPQLPNQGNNAVASGLCPGEYTIEVTDGAGCQTVTMVATVLDRRFPCLSAREVITPNGDGLNETFILFCSGEDAAINNTMEIYNRWGQLVFETDDYNCSDDDGLNCFDGRTNDGTPLPAGPYYYIFNFTNPIGEEMQQRGSLTIVRE